MSANDEIVLNEKKTKKERRVNLNNACVAAMQALLASKEYSDEDYYGATGAINGSYRECKGQVVV